MLNILLQAFSSEAVLQFLICIMRLSSQSMHVLLSNPVLYLQVNACPKGQDLTSEPPPCQSSKRLI